MDQKHFLAPASVLNAITDTFASTQIGDPDRIAPSWQNELWGASIIVSDSYILHRTLLSGIWQLSIKYNAERKHPSSHQSMVEIERKILSNDLSIQGCEEGYVGNNACTKCPAVYYSHSIWNEQCIRCPPSLLSPAGSYRSSACTSQGALEGTGCHPSTIQWPLSYWGNLRASCRGVCVDSDPHDIEFAISQNKKVNAYSKKKQYK